MKLKLILFLLGVQFAKCADEVNTVVGDGSSNIVDGIGVSASLGEAGGFVQISTTEIWFSDTTNNVIRSVNPYSKEVNLELGPSSGATGTVDGTATNIRFNQPKGLSYAQSTKTLYIADFNQHFIRSYSMTLGTSDTICGSTSGYQDGVGTTGVMFSEPSDLALSTDETTLYVADKQSIRKINLSTLQVTRVAGTSSSGSSTGVGTNARFRRLTGIIANANYLFAVDQDNFTVKKIAIATLLVSNFAGDSDDGESNSPGTGSGAEFLNAHAITFGLDDTVMYVGTRSAIMKIVTSTAQVTRISGPSVSTGHVDGSATGARYDTMTSIITSSSGRIFVGESQYIRSFEYDGYTQSPTFIVSPTPSPVVPTPFPTPEPTLNPTTLSPVTSQPVTISPATSQPITVSPVTSQPVTISPVTSEPVTISPVTSEPITVSPVTLQPVTVSPVTSHPVSTSPTISPSSLSPSSCSPSSLSPTTRIPSSCSPATAHPASVHPASNAPLTSGPISASPATLNPATSHPGTTHPVSSHPATSHPASSHPLSLSPATSVPLTTSPTTLSPVSSHPGTAHPVSISPSTFSPSLSPNSMSPTASPVSMHPGTCHPASVAPSSLSPSLSPATASPVSLHPGTSHPGSMAPSSLGPSGSPVTANPGSCSPISLNPATVSPASVHPATSHPGSSHPATSHPGSSHPATFSPVSVHPATSHPGSFHPVTFSPASAHPATSHPGSSHPATFSPASVHPATSHPGSSHPATFSPVSLHPATSHPGSSHPVTLTPATNTPITRTPSTSVPTHVPTGAPSTCPTTRPSTSPSVTPTAEPSMEANAPMLMLVSAEEVGICGIVKIETSVQSVGSVVLSWFLNGNPITSTQPDSLVLSYSEVQTLATASGIGSLVDGTVLPFTARVFDQATGLSSTLQQASITHRGIMKPALVIAGPNPSVTVRPSKALRLSAAVQHASCLSVNASDLSSIRLGYSWDITAGGTSLGLNLESSPEIIIPSGSLLPSQIHQITVTLSGTESLYPGVPTVQTTLTLTAADVPVIAVLSTGSSASIPSGTQVTLDASKSNDPALLSGAVRSFSWSCTLPDSNSCTSSLTPSPSSETALLSDTALTTGQTLTITLTFTVTVDLGGSLGSIIRSSTVSSTLSGVSRAPLVSIIHKLSAATSSAGTLPANAALRLSSSVTPDTSSSSTASQLTYAWTEASGVLQGLSESKRLSDFRGPALVLAAGALTSGSTYTFTLTVVDPSTEAGAGVATVVVDVLASPSVTSVTFEPSSGVARKTEFGIRAYAMVGDSSQLPLYYLFLTKYAGAKAKLSGLPQLENTKELVIENTGSVQVGVEVRDSFGSTETLWSSGSIDVQASGASSQDICLALNDTSGYLIDLLSENGYVVNAPESCYASGIFFYLNLLSSLKFHSTFLEASTYILSFLGSFPSITSPSCLSCTPYPMSNSYESALFSHLLTLLQISANSSAYAPQSAQALYLLATSPLALNSSTSSQSSIISTLLLLSPDLSPTSPSGSRTSNFIAGALASVASSDPNADELARSLLLGVSADMIPGESPAALQTSAFDAHVQAVEASSSQATVSATSGVTVTVPSGLSSDDSDARLMIVSWESGLPADAPKADGESGESLASGVEDVTLTDASGNLISIPEGETIRIEIPLKSGESSDSSLACVYIQESTGGGAWAEEGCSLDVQGESVACVCTHLTEFAVMRRARSGQGMPEFLKWSYVAGAGVAWVIAIASAVQAGRLANIQKHRGWVGVVHYMLMGHGLGRGLSSLMLSGIASEFSLYNSPPIVVVIIVALPYSFSFWTASLVAFQWMATAFNPRLLVNNFHENRVKYYLMNAAVVFLSWALIFAMWILDIKEVSIVGPAIFAILCLGLVTLYLIGGLTIMKQLKKSFSMMAASRDSAKIKTKIKQADQVGETAITYAICFSAISVVWILSAVFRDNILALKVLVPSFLLLDAFSALLILYMYSRTVKLLIRKSSTSGTYNSENRISARMSSRYTQRRTRNRGPTYTRRESHVSSNKRMGSRKDLFRNGSRAELSRRDGSSHNLYRKDVNSRPDLRIRDGKLDSVPNMRESDGEDSHSQIRLHRPARAVSPTRATARKKQILGHTGRMSNSSRPTTPRVVVRKQDEKVVFSAVKSLPSYANTPNDSPSTNQTGLENFVHSPESKTHLPSAVQPVVSSSRRSFNLSPLRNSELHFIVERSGIPRNETPLVSIREPDHILSMSPAASPSSETVVFSRLRLNRQRRESPNSNQASLCQTEGRHSTGSPDEIENL